MSQEVKENLMILIVILLSVSLIIAHTKLHTLEEKVKELETKQLINDLTNRTNDNNYI